MCVLIFCTAFVWNINQSKKKWARSDQKCILVFMWCNRYSCQILMKLEFSRQTVEKYSNIKSMTIYPVGAELSCSLRRTDMTFRNCANAPKNEYSVHLYVTR
jgi:hypothetical protein